MAIWRSQHYRKIACEAGVDASVTDNAIATVEALRRRSQNAPAILSLRHLSVRSGVRYSYLRSVVERKALGTYRLFRIRKRPLPGEPLRYRVITVPDPRLKKIQQWIDQRILSQAVPDEASVAFVRGSSVYDAAAMHCRARWLIKIDIRSFFESITEQQVYGVFLDMGYQPLISFELARICTRLRSRIPSSGRWKPNNKRSYDIEPYCSGQLGHVPQGAPTSPRLSNLVVRALDEELRTIAAGANLFYTRYADDLTLSTTSDAFSRRAASKIIGKVYRAIGSCGFSPNLSKTQIVSPRARKVVLGLLVDGDSPRLQREFKARIRQHLYYLTNPQVGPARHAAASGNATIYGLRNHIQGLLAFAHGVEPDYARKQTKVFKSVSWP